MLVPTISAYIFSVLIAVVVLFQLALALGAPWGAMAMGGKFPGRFPAAMRIVAVIQAGLLIFIALIVLTRAGVVFTEYADISKTAIWGIVIFSLIGTILNIITPSKKERMLWAPVSFTLLICCSVVAMT